MYKFLIGLGSCILLLGGPGGCETMKVQDRSIVLGNETRAYRKAIRWGEYDLARELIRRRDGTVPEYDARFLQHVRVTSFEITKRELRNDSMEAVVASLISYYHIDSGSLRTITDTQTWWYDPVTLHWYIDGTLPDFAGGLRSN